MADKSWLLISDSNNSRLVISRHDDEEDAKLRRRQERIKVADEINALRDEAIELEEYRVGIPQRGTCSSRQPKARNYQPYYITPANIW